MAVKQEGALQRPPKKAQPKRAANSTSDTDTRQAPEKQAQQEQAQQEQGSPDQDFSQALAQQVAQAIQPVLDDFRQQVTQTLEQQVGGITEAVHGGQGAQAQVQESQSAQPTAAPGQAAQATQSAVAQALQPVLKTVEHDGKQWLQAMLVAGLSLLLADSTRAAIEQRADQGIHTLTQKAFEAAPDGVNNQEMQAKTEYALQTIVRGSLDAIFAGGMRAAVQQGGQAAIQESFRGDFAAALKALSDVLKAIAEALIAELRKQWQTLLRLALALVFLELASILEQS